MFTLVKWYLDLVTDEGTAIIGYSGRLESGPVRVGYSSVLTSVAGAPAGEARAFGDAEGPRHAGDTITWNHPTLDVSGCWRRLAGPIVQPLIESPVGDVRWNCLMPRSSAEVVIGGTRYAGLGYVERLTLTLAPWRLPFTSLRWGRYASTSSSIVWIAWSGADARRFIWHDGQPQPAAVLGDRGIRDLAGGAELHIGRPRDVCARSALRGLVDRLPGPARTLVTPVAAMVEHKMVASSRLTWASGDVDQGWSLFEEVRW